MTVIALCRPRQQCTGWVRIHLLGWSRQTQGFQPEIEVVDPVVARFALSAHAEAVTASAKDVQFRFVTCGLKRVVEPCDERLCAGIVVGKGGGKRGGPATTVGASTPSL